MNQISDNELKEIIASYGLADLLFDGAEPVDPDTVLYFFHDAQNKDYILLATDYPGGYYDVKLPNEFIFDYHDDGSRIVKFTALCRYSYVSSAPKAATGYIDDEHYLTAASTGDTCVLFGCSDIVRR